MKVPWLLCRKWCLIMARHLELNIYHYKPTYHKYTTCMITIMKFLKSYIIKNNSHYTQPSLRIHEENIYHLKSKTSFSRYSHKNFTPKYKRYKWQLLVSKRRQWLISLWSYFLLLYTVLYLIFHSWHRFPS